MYYDDTTRRFNFLAGLGFGAVLGVGLAMLAAPQKKVRLRRPRKASGAGSGALPAELMERIRAGRRRR
jgi:hypothetical protein